MRTTIRLNEELFRRTKRRALEDHKSFTTFVENALRLFLDKKSRVKKLRHIKIPTCGSGGIQPGIDLDNTSELLDRMEGFS